MICARLSVLNRFILTILLDRSDRTVKMRLFIKRYPKSAGSGSVPFVIDLSAAQARLGGYHDKLVDAHHAAIGTWATMVRDQPRYAKPLDTTTRANFIQNHVCREVEIALADDTGVAFPDRLGFFAIYFRPDILLRFKYVGTGCPSNVATTQQRLLARQQFSGELMLALAEVSALTPPTLLTCGYTLDGHALGRLEIRRDCKGQLPWAYDIYGGETVAEPLTFPGTADTAKPARVTTRRRKTAHGKDAAQAETA